MAVCVIERATAETEMIANGIETLAGDKETGTGVSETAVGEIERLVAEAEAPTAHLYLATDEADRKTGLCKNDAGKYIFQRMV